MGWLSKTLQRAIDDEEQLIRSLSRLLIAASLAALVVLIIALVSHIRVPGELNSSKMGTFGDFIGGALNPALTFITFLALLFTILIQQKELAHARSEFRRTAVALEQENFEATFFRLMELMRETVEAITLNDQKGVAAFEELYRAVRGRYKAHEAIANQPTKVAFEFRYNQYGHYFAHYFRTTYNVLRFLERKHLDIKAALRDDPDAEILVIDIRMYAKLLRAQISDHEMAILFYNSLTDRGVKMKRLLEVFSILDNLDDRYLLEPTDKALIGTSAWGG